MGPFGLRAKLNTSGGLVVQDVLSMCAASMWKISGSIPL